jgi:hypothetical protein
MEYEDYYFATGAEAEAAMKIANAKWAEPEAPAPNGRVWSVKLEDETIIEIAEGGFPHFAAISEDNEYMVSVEDPEWVCVA